MAILLVCSSFAYGKEKLIFGVNPYRDAETLREIHQELMDYLEKELEKEIVFIVSSDYEHLSELIKNRSVDFASVSPRLVSKTRKQVKGLEYLATIKTKNEKQEATSSYHGLIIAKNDGSIKTLEDLRGKRFGFTDKYSTSGYFYPKMLLRDANIDSEKDFSKVFMLKKHPKIVYALLEGSIDAGAIYEGTYWAMKEEIGDRLHILTTTEEIPYDAIWALPHLDKDIAQKIKKLLLKFHSDKEGDGAIVGFEEKSIALYDRLATFE